MKQTHTITNYRLLTIDGDTDTFRTTWNNRITTAAVIVSLLFLVVTVARVFLIIPQVAQ